jgi:hypothetical protein
MNIPGPSLELLLRRLTETPVDFLDEPRVGGTGQIHVTAVVNDCLRHFGPSAHGAEIQQFEQTAASEPNRLRLALLLAWLLSEPWFKEQKIAAGDILKALSETARELSPYVTARKCVEDPDRREELARFTLARLDMRPAGESLAQAQDRLTTMSTAERGRVVRAAREAEARSRAIREALARKAAEESADKYTRE